MKLFCWSIFYANWMFELSVRSWIKLQRSISAEFVDYIFEQLKLEKNI